MELESHFPAAYGASGDASAAAQNAFMRSTVVRLVALSLAGILAEIEHVVAHWAVVAVFVAAVAVELHLLIQRPERAWYSARAGAESVKSLAWRYSVRGAPFAGDDADALFAQRLREVLDDLADVKFRGASFEQLTGEMRNTRNRPLVDRKQIYEEQRLLQQHGWYSTRRSENERRATIWIVVLVVLEGGAVVAALLRALGYVDFDLFGVVGAVAASAAAWLQTRQHQNLAAAYDQAARDLSVVHIGLAAANDAVSWAQFVDDAENAMSREHTTWRARRGA